MREPLSDMDRRLLYDHFSPNLSPPPNVRRHAVDDVPGEVHAQLARLELGRKVRPGQTVAITAGSRGIANIAVITPGNRRASEAARGTAVHRAGHGQPRRRHRRRPAAAHRIVRHHRGFRRLPDPLEHGNGRRRPRGRRFSDPFRPPGLRGRSRAGLQSRQAAHRASPARSKAG